MFILIGLRYFNVSDVGFVHLFCHIIFKDSQRPENHFIRLKSKDRFQKNLPFGLDKDVEKQREIRRKLEKRK